jgi:hypothetical protein
MSINLYKNWDPSKGDYIDENLELERVQRQKDRVKQRLQLIFFGIIFVGLIVFSLWYAARVRK